jgi:membrane associated rhomboid family serine protease
LPLSDRDYMQRSRPPSRRSWRPGGYRGLDPILTLIGLNILFFLATSIRPDLIITLGLSPVFLAQRPWTIITAMFVHYNFWHIFGNMLVLFFFGRALYQMVGQNRFLLVYFIGGIVGNIVFILLNLDRNVLVVGASGAIYAITGTLVVLVPKLRVYVFFIAPMPLWVVIVFFFILWSFIFPGVAWQAHLGGIATGALAGYIFRRRRRNYYQ